MPIGPSVTNYHTRPASSCTWSNSISTEFRATASTTCPVISRKIGRGTTVGVGVGSSVGFTVGIAVGGGVGGRFCRLGRCLGGGDGCFSLGPAATASENSC